MISTQDNYRNTSGTQHIKLMSGSDEDHSSPIYIKALYYVFEFMSASVR